MKNRDLFDISMDDISSGSLLGGFVARMARWVAPGSDKMCDQQSREGFKNARGELSRER